VSPSYSGTGYGLDCTIEDGKCWYDMLTQTARVPAECIRWISDSKRYKQVNRNSTTRDIIQELEALVQWSHKSVDPVIFIVYSGHGTQQRDDNNDEEDGLDEGWVASDLGFVRDDYLNQQVLAKFPSDAKVIAVNDACYNGTIWDSPQTAMYVSGEVPHISRSQRARMGTVVVVTDPLADSTVIVGPADVQYEAKTVSDQPPVTVHTVQLLLAITALVYALIEYRRVKQFNKKIIAAFCIVLASISSIANARKTTARPTRQTVLTPVASSLQTTQQALDAAIAKYSAQVSMQINSGASKEKLPIACQFSGFSSSNDKQVSYEGAKNGFFTY
jgi:Caspase domain